LQGSPKYYDEIVKQLRIRDDPDMVWRLYVSLSKTVSSLTLRPEKYRDLIQSIFSYNWMGEAKLDVAIVGLIEQLVTANTIFLIPSLQMLVKQMVPNKIVEKKTNTELSVPPERGEVERRRIHRFMEGLLRLVPSGHSEVISIIESNFPHKRFPKDTQKGYISELLCICGYSPSLQQRTLQVIVSKCLEIDVEIVIEDSGNVIIEKDTLDESGDENDDNIFQLDEENDQTDLKVNTRAEPILTVTTKKPCVTMEAESQKIAPEVEEMADKLDAMLTVLFGFLETEMMKGKEEKEKVLAQLLCIFEERILSAHRSKFVQFLLFFGTLRCDDFSITFGEKLLDIFYDGTVNELKRQSAVVYLASFLARSTTISPQFLHHCLAELLGWVDSYIDDSSGSQAGVNSIGPNEMSKAEHEENYEIDDYGRRVRSRTSTFRHETFYCCVQALCYIMCFRGTSLAQNQKESTTFRSSWEKIVSCPLQPLRYCLHSVRSEFLRLADHTDLFQEEYWAYLPPDIAEEVPGRCSSRVSSSRRGRLTSSAGVGMGTGKNPLDSFFPFDPLLLHHSCEMIGSGYRYWAGLPGIDFEEIEEERSTCSAEETIQRHEQSHLAMSLETNGSILFESKTKDRSNSATSYGSSIQSDTDVSQQVSVSNGQVDETAPPGWGLPLRRPRQLSIGSTGSW
jgi:RNA polymerase I-specific transcription initiation factor RRN3